MFRFSISNIRKLKKNHTVNMKRLNILVGKNSSGKSTFLRTFPLVKQSITTRTSAPILWFGDFVDFGDFENSVSDHDKTSGIILNLGADRIPFKPTTPQRFLRANFQKSIYNEKENISADLSITIVEYKNMTRISEIFFTINSDEKIKYSIKVDEKQRIYSIKINDEEIDIYKDDIEVSIEADATIPIIMLNSKKKNDARNPSELLATQRVNLFTNPFFLRKMYDVVSRNISKRVSENNKFAHAASLMALVPFTKKNIGNLKDSNSSIAWSRFLENIISDQNQEIYKEIRDINLLYNIQAISESISNYFLPIFREVLYIGPARVKSDRYYRYQDLSVSEIAPDGTNFPMFLNSLSESNRQKFSDWVKSLFGYGVSVEKTSNHISVSLKYDNEKVNVIDTGYGVSQILPVLGQVWWASNRPVRKIFNSGETILAIEQPELHLHPAHQALLADVFSSVSEKSENQQNVTYIIETHSETLINRIGELIYKKEISNNDVQILLFDDRSDTSSETIIRVSEFDKQGNLLNWPFGFFNPEIKK
ncbi:DUF3696 domain-containing protein [Gluconobacter cadivus]|uniref:DUF3696 domain-containing protein n=1 Tax=Gluconobacter cadivus TaxID=2728101 RepID=A0ABR9YWH4_9PROT|nr:DUF3696 domain-containing protein [Gluconobacter cadivus]MBF0888900.1 DUF3696 domain-containing protein [Gluconobacter cadivus]